MRRAAQMLGLERSHQRVDIHHGAARRVDQLRARFHARQLRRADHAMRLRRFGHVQRHDVGRFEQRVERRRRRALPSASLVSMS